MQFSSRSIHSYLPDSTAIISVILVIAASNSILVTNAMALPTTNESEKLFLVISKPQVDVDEDGFQEVKRNPVVVFRCVKSWLGQENPIEGIRRHLSRYFSSMLSYRFDPDQLHEHFGLVNVRLLFCILFCGSNFTTIFPTKLGKSNFKKFYPAFVCEQKTTKTTVWLILGWAKKYNSLYNLLGKFNDLYPTL